MLWHKKCDKKENHGILFLRVIIKKGESFLSHPEEDMAALIVVDLLYYGLVKRNKEEYAQKIINTRRIIQEMEK